MAKANYLSHEAEENAFKYHSMKHDFSFRLNDYSSKLILLIFNSKFSHAHKQNETMAIDILASLEDFCRQILPVLYQHLRLLLRKSN